MNLKGIYYNGIESKGFDAILIIENETVSIQIIETGKIISWLSSKIDYQNFGGTNITLNYLNENKELEIFESTTIRDKEKYEEIKKELYFLHKDLSSKILFHNYKAIIPITAVILGLMALTYFYFIPNLAEHLASKTPLNMENELGKYIDNSISSSLEIDTVKTKNIKAFYQQLNHKSKYKIEISVVKDDETINAFAIPSGKIYVYSGLIKKVNKPEQLVALLYHEIGHVENKHSLKHLYRTLSRSIILSALLNDVNGLSNAIIENADMLVQLKYSKELETEADYYSLENMKKQHIDINGFIGLFEILEKESSTSDIPEFISTHPLNKTRINNAKKYQLEQKNIVVDKKLDSIFWRI